MADPVALMVTDLKEKYEAAPSSPRFTRLYEDPEWGHMFAVLHKRLNQHFVSINGRIKTANRHYWAENSRDLLALINEIEIDLHTLKRIGVEVEFDARYQEALDRCSYWLVPSGGSPIPEGFEPIQLIEYEPLFTRARMSVTLVKEQQSAHLKMMGSGSYAHVYSYVDPDYGIQFAVKRAKKGLSERDLLRFKQEFAVMKKLSFPYVVEVYKYNDDLNEYRMEYCDTTLREYVKKRNSDLRFGTRKRIALQFLYGINYLHANGYLHRDISLQNTLLKVYGDSAVLVKLSDFGLVKDLSADFTHTQTDMKGTYRDPMLASFKEYVVANEMYSIAWVLAYIFTGKEKLPPSDAAIGQIIHKCASHDLDKRYKTVLELIADVEQVAAPPAKATA